MTELLSGKTAVITGAMSGNGREMSIIFAEHGADVVVADIRDEPRQDGAPTQVAIEEQTDANAAFVNCDVSQKEDLEEAMDVADEFGGVDVMINNAGVFRAEDFLSLSEEEYEQLMDINSKGVFFGSQVAANRMVEQETEGSIINISSAAGHNGAGDHVSYCASKGAVRLMTYAMADALGAEGIQVNVIHPNAIDTAMINEDVPVIGTEAGEAYLEMIPEGRFGKPEDVAGTAVYLASELSSYVNGSSINVDGGFVNTV
jgi:NAD(P)-dependent dehydrogenase (short-subunit alcohol dehydrogenase family)